jgi:hypothetical protein
MTEVFCAHPLIGTIDNVWMHCPICGYKWKRLEPTPKVIIGYVQDAEGRHE